MRCVVCALSGLMLDGEIYVIYGHSMCSRHMARYFEYSYSASDLAVFVAKEAERL